MYIQGTHYSAWIPITQIHSQHNSCCTSGSSKARSSPLSDHHLHFFFSPPTSSHRRVLACYLLGDTQAILNLGYCLFNITISFSLGMSGRGFLYHLLIQMVPCFPSWFHKCAFPPTVSQGFLLFTPSC